ncbi:hypothetical protein, partial [Corynebacterium belfantii]|uniref:hypothetical protein n=1 Tax=Corynebacterium belfantii TaxID=2014537 RepID=UPI001A7E7524
PDSTNATASALNCSEYNFGMINILPCPAPAKQARRQPNPQQTLMVPSFIQIMAACTHQQRLAHDARNLA